MNTRNTASEAPLRAIFNPAGILPPPQRGWDFEPDPRFGRPDGRTLDPQLRTSPPPASVPVADPRGQQPDPLIGHIVAGRYRLLTKLGQGGMGVVYKAEHLRLNRLAAIKMLSSKLSGQPEYVARFHREAEMLSRLNHPNVVATYDFGEAEDGLLYLAMEFLDGQPLSALLTQDGPLPLARVVKIVWQAAAALHAAHQLGLIHRDFKPGNVMVCQPAGQADWVKVVDFGVAKWLRADPREKALTRRGLVLGTPQYMSPEQVAGKELDARSDLYSLALVAYEMLAGERRGAGSKPPRQMNESPLPFTHYRPQLVLPAAVEPVIRKALARDPEERYASTVEFAMALEAAARGESLCQLQPVATRPLARASGGAGGQMTIAEQSERTSPLDRAVREGRGRILPERARRSLAQARRLAVDIGVKVIVLAAVLGATSLLYPEALRKPAAATVRSPGEASLGQSGGPRQSVQTSVTIAGQPDRVASPDGVAKHPLRPGGKGEKTSPSKARRRVGAVSAGQISGGEQAGVGLLAAGKSPAESPTAEKTAEGRTRVVGGDPLAQGMEWMQLGAYAEALAALGAAERAQPTNPDVHYLRGLVYEKLGRRAEALAEYRQCQSGPYSAVSSRHVRHLSKRERSV